MNDITKRQFENPYGELLTFNETMPLNNCISFCVGGREVMTLRRNSVEIAEGMEVSETAQAVFEALETLITNAWGTPKKRQSNAR